jgi:NitT/TauT family transport system permease protein
MTASPLLNAINHERARSRLVDLLVLGTGLAVFYLVLSIGRTWLGPSIPAAPISRSPAALPVYAAYSLLRLVIAYGLSLGFALVYGYIAAYHAKAERLMLPLLDILQSIPVLSFLPGVMLAMVALFPGREIGIELGAILLIFTGEAWNLAFSFYSSLKAIPLELKEAARSSRFNWWQRFTQLELPYAAIGLVWNSMMSMAGGWFFLMACEMFVLGARDFRLPGLGSYLQTAASAGDTTDILWGLGAMIGVIVLLDQLIWRPLIAWADKFKLEQVECTDAPRSAVFNLLHRSAALAYFQRKAVTPLSEYITSLFVRYANTRSGPKQLPSWKRWILSILGVMVLAAIGYAFVQAILLLTYLTGAELGELALGVVATFLRVNVALLIGAAWAIPTGVMIGLNPRLARVAQPLAQIAASVPATALFPVVLLVLIRAGGGMGIASVLLLLLGSQFYILFNVIAGAMAIPSDLKEAARVFRFSRVDRWRLVILPVIFPHLITGMATAAGGAWNASIIAEYFHFKGESLSTIGLGATISQATDTGNFALLLSATMVMAMTVVTINRLVWRRLYRLAEVRYKLEI